MATRTVAGSFEGIRYPKHGRVDLTDPMRTGCAARVRAGFGRAALAIDVGDFGRARALLDVLEPRQPGTVLAFPQRARRETD
jgi:hypothetical protein